MTIELSEGAVALLKDIISRTNVSPTDKEAPKNLALLQEILTALK